MTLSCRSTSAPKIANPRLLTGPIAATSNAPVRYDTPFRLAGFQRTGFAHPTNATNTRIVPTGSRCRKGFSVSLLSQRGVGSPNRTAIHA